MLELRSVTKRYSGIAAVQDVSFVAHAGEVTGMVGVKVGDEHGFQAGEVELRVGEGGRRPAAAHACPD